MTLKKNDLALVKGFFGPIELQGFEVGDGGRDFCLYSPLPSDLGSLNFSFPPKTEDWVCLAGAETPKTSLAGPEWRTAMGRADPRGAEQSSRGRVIKEHV